MDVFNCTKKELLELEEQIPTQDFDGFVIVPTGGKHESGYECMKFILTHTHDIVGVVGGNADMVHLNGIGGYGKAWVESLRTRKVDVTDWKIDFLPKSHCVHIFTSKKLELGRFFNGSDFCVLVK